MKEILPLSSRLAYLFLLAASLMAAPLLISYQSVQAQGTPDTTPPDTTITSSVDGNGKPIQNGGSTSSNIIRFMFRGIDSTGAVSNFQCSLDNRPYSTCSSGANYAGLVIGSHSFAVASMDSSGNIDQSVATFAWSVTDSQSPTPTPTPSSTPTSSQIAPTQQTDLVEALQTESDCGPGTIFYPKAGKCVPVTCPAGTQRTSKGDCAPPSMLGHPCDIKCQQTVEKAVKFAFEKARDAAIGLVIGPWKYLSKILKSSDSIMTFETSGCANNPSPEIFANCLKEFPWLKNYECITFQGEIVCYKKAPETPPEVCGDGIDNNFDGQIDEGCQEICGNGFDDNNNGMVDEGCSPVGCAIPLGAITMYCPRPSGQSCAFNHLCIRAGETASFSIRCAPFPYYNTPTSDDCQVMQDKCNFDQCYPPGSTYSISEGIGTWTWTNAGPPGEYAVIIDHPCCFGLITSVTVF